MESPSPSSKGLRDQFRTPLVLILLAIIGVLIITIVTEQEFFQYEVYNLSNLRWFMRTDEGIFYGESWTEKEKCESKRREFLREAEDSYLRHYDLYLRKPCPLADLKICMQGVWESADDVNRLRRVFCAQRDF
jgi:hypothetical protein